MVAETPMVDKYSVSAGAAVDSELARELVYTNRNYQSLITSLPGVVHSDQSTQLAELMPSVNGNLWQENAAFVDGIDTANTRYGGGSRMILPTGALAEVRSDASGYGAEYGRVVGGVTGVVTKSGADTFHGDFQYIAQNQKWEAQSDDVLLPREDDCINSYEASLGGPILVDKLWFFAAAGDNDTNQISSLAGGDLIQNSVTSESYIGKLNFNPTPRHSLVGTYIDAPAVVPFFATIYGDLPHGVRARPRRQLRDRELELDGGGQPVPRGARRRPGLEREPHPHHHHGYRAGRFSRRPRRQPRRLLGHHHHAALACKCVAPGPRRARFSPPAGQRRRDLVRPEQWRRRSTTRT